MNKQIDNIKKVRLFLLENLKDLSVEQMNKIPSGFNNNIAWNLGHLIAAQQGLCYLRANAKPVVDEKYTAFKSGTKPERDLNDHELAAIKDTMLSSLDQLQADYKNNVFTNYNPWVTRYGVELANIDDAIRFLGFHEGLHSGHIMALKRVVKNKSCC